MSGSGYESFTGDFSRDLGRGDIFENAIVDAQGGEIDLSMSDGSTLRNVGLLNDGTADAMVNPTARNGGSIMIDHCYFENGGGEGLFVNASHNGHLDVHNSYFNNFGEDFAYASPPSNPDTQEWADATGKDRGQGGTLLVRNSYGANAEDYGFRYGNGRAVNARVVNAGVAFASLYRSATFENVHAADSSTTLRVGTPVDENREYTPNQVSATLKGTVEFNGGESNFDIRSGGGGPGVVNGTAGSNPNTQIQAGIPTTADEAASGTSTAEPAPAPTTPGGTPGGTSGSAPTAEPAPIADCEYVVRTAPVTATPGGTGGAPSGGAPSGGGGGSAPVPSGAGDIGGGDTYSDTYTAADADTVVSGGDGSAAASAIENASSGETVFLEPGRYTIDRVSLSADGMSLVSNRGVDGAQGATIVGGGPEARPIQAEASDFLISGLRFEGPDTTWDGEAGSNDHHPVGIDHQSGQGMRVSNCEGYGWEAIFAAPRADGPDTVNHCYIHDNPGASMGYGVQSGPSSGLTLIERNYFENCRHEIAADPENNGYEIRDNIFAPRYYNHAVDQHGPDPAGGTLLIHHNTFAITEAANSQDKEQCINIRGKPADRCDIYKNLFYTSNKARAINQSGESKVGQSDQYTGDAENMDFTDNMRVYDNVWGQQSAADAGARTGDSATTAIDFARQVA